jgi:hypothetical protein
MLNPRHWSRLLILLGFTLLSLSGGQTVRAEGYVPATSGFDTEIKVWTSGANTYAKVVLTFPTGGWRVDWGQVTRSGNNFTADARVERWNGITTQAITYQENTYNLGTLPAGTYTFTFKSWGVVIKSQQFDPTQVVEHWEPVVLTTGIGLSVWTTDAGITYTKVALYLPDTGYSVVDWGQVVRNGNEFSIDVKAERWTGETQKRTVLVSHDYELGALQAGSYTLVIKMYGTTVKNQPFTINAPAKAAPKLLTEDGSEQAVALDSVTWLRLFPLVTTHNFSQDQRSRVVLFLAGTDLTAAEYPSVTVQAEDAQQVVRSFVVEYVGKVPGFDWLTQVIARPPDALKDGGDVWVRVGVGGQLSNRAKLSLKPSPAN